MESGYVYELQVFRPVPASKPVSEAVIIEFAALDNTFAAQLNTMLMAFIIKSHTWQQTSILRASGYNQNSIVFTDCHLKERNADRKKGLPRISTETIDARYYAETYHQQYLAKNPNGYCGLGGTGV